MGWDSHDWRTARLVLGVGVLLLPLLLSPDSGTHPDEETYAAVSTEMAASGSWLVPTRDGEAVFFKPPLLYWVQAAAIRCLGRSLFAVRFPTWLALLGLGLLTGRLARRWMEPQRATVAAALTLTSLATLRFGVLGMMDVGFALALLGAVAFAVQVAEREGWLVASAACVAGAVWLKGPVGVLLGVPLVAGSLWAVGARVRWRVVLGASAVGTALALPWFLAMVLQRGEEFVSLFVAQEHLQKLSGDRSLVSWLSHPFWLGLGACPWVLLLSRRALRGPPGRLLAVASGAFLVVYLTQTSRQLHYAVPWVPFVSVAVAAVGPGKGSRVLAGLLALAGVGAGVAASVALSAVWVLGLALGGAALFGAAVAVWRGSLTTGAVLGALAWTVVMWSASLTFPPQWPPQVARATRGRPVFFPADVGVARLASGVNLHRGDAAPQRRLWVGLDAQFDERFPRLVRWERLKMHVSADDVRRVWKERSVAPVAETWSVVEATE